MKYVVLLRGINVGGHKRMAMKQLRAALDKAGLEVAHTVLQSGNIILESPSRSAEVVATAVHDAIEEEFGFDVSVLVRSVSAFKKEVAACPFAAEAVKDGKTAGRTHTLPGQGFLPPRAVGHRPLEARGSRGQSRR